MKQDNYPIVIFDPHGDYTGLADVPELADRVRRYYAWFPIFEQDAETVATVVESLGWQLAKTHRERFETLFEASRAFLFVPPQDLRQRGRDAVDGVQRLGRYADQRSAAQLELLP